MPALVERPKMSIAMWAALKNHIMRQREKKKQEQEADAATERVRRERELKRRQDAMTLEEIRDQVQQSEKKLATLKDEKHQLFMQLKKVLHEDDTRKRALVKEANEMAALNHSYLQQQHNAAMHQHAAAAAAAAAAALPQHLYIQDINRAHSMYKLAQPIPQNPSVLHRAPLKRQLTPSPPSVVASCNFIDLFFTAGDSTPVGLLASAAVRLQGPDSGIGGVRGTQADPGLRTGPRPHLLRARPRSGFGARGHGSRGTCALSGLPDAPALEPPHGLQKPRFHDEKFYVSQPSMVPMRTLASPAAQSAALALASPQPKPSSYLTAAQQHQMAAAAAAAQRHPGYPGQPTRFY
ncbi:hypothetical protein MTO96_028909 [Rhipicephalus appendiculatus]